MIKQQKRFAFLAVLALLIALFPAKIHFFERMPADLSKYLQKCRLLRRKHLNCPRFEKIPALLQVFAQNEPISRKYLHFCRFSLGCIQKEHYLMIGSALSLCLAASYSPRTLRSKYHRRWRAYRSCSGWERVEPLRHRHQTVQAFDRLKTGYETKVCVLDDFG